MAPGTFDDRTHEQLAAMLANGAPAKVSSHAQLLQDASRLIAEISVHVRAAVDKADWSGESATAYRAWAKHFAQEGGRLSTYANTVGGALQRAGQALTDAQAAMPRPAADAALKGEQNAPVGDDPATSREKARQEAIRTLERLDSYYSVTTTDLRTAQEPNFRPPQPPGLPQPAIEVSTTGSGPVDRTHAPPTPSGGPAPDPRGARENPAATDVTRTTLDSVAAPAPAEARSQPTPASSAPSQGTSSGLSIGPNAAAPPLGPTARPGTAFLPGSASGRGTAQGNAAPRTPTPGQAFAGSAGGHGAGGNAGASAPGRAVTPAPHPGIHGGRMRPAGPPTSTGRGTVISGPAGPIGSTSRPGATAPGVASGVSSQQQTPARRLATEPGGTAPPRHHSGAGSGTAPRNGVVGGASAPVGSAPATRGEQRKNPRSNRPPGLASDRFELSEEQLRKIVPPVIG